MRLVHLSDFHLTRLTWNPFRLFPKRIFGQCNWVFRRDREFSPHLLFSLPPLLQKLSVEKALLGGDFTTTALPEEFSLAAQFVQSLSLPWIAIPGNHDHYTKQSLRQKRFYRYFANEPPSWGSLARERLEVHPLCDKWWVIALDTAMPTSLSSSQGTFPLSLETSLQNALSWIPSTDKILLFNHYPFFLHDAPHRTLQGGERLEAILRSDRRILLYLQGHTHRHTIADLQEEGLPILLDSGSCSQGPRATFHLLDLEETRCKVTLYRWNREWYPDREEAFSWKR